MLYILDQSIFEEIALDHFVYYRERLYLERNPREKKNIYICEYVCMNSIEELQVSLLINENNEMSSFYNLCDLNFCTRFEPG